LDVHIREMNEAKIRIPLVAELWENLEFRRPEGRRNEPNQSEKLSGPFGGQFVGGERLDCT
jgi:hypothetical protein